MARTNSKPKPAAEQTNTSIPQPPPDTTASTSRAAGEPRENPRINEKIDEWIKQNPDDWKYFLSLPPERMARKLVLNEINKYERQQKAKQYQQEEQHGGETTPRNDRSQGNGMKTR
jgi:hypothetical protein